jgi:ubiquinol-cytochrome c reductase iron-sulfur subunit
VRGLLVALLGLLSGLLWRRVRPLPDPLVVAALGLSALGSLGFVVVYVLGADTRLLGVTMATALGGLGSALVLWVRRDMPRHLVEEPWEPPVPSTEEREALRRELARMPRRRFVERLLLMAGGALGLALAVPAASLGPRPGGRRRRTAWEAGVRLTTDGTEPVRPGDLGVGEILTAFPEGHPADARAQVNLIRLAEGDDGLVAYSRVCTHAGCAVGLYQPESQRLFCPCHQSQFDVLDGARPIAGPAGRALPRLPIESGPDGVLRATGDFPDPVGPSTWERA